jgi:hypothetical protein
VSLTALWENLRMCAHSSQHHESWSYTWSVTSTACHIKLPPVLLQCGVHATWHTSFVTNHTVVTWHDLFRLTTSIPWWNASSIRHGVMTHALWRSHVCIHIQHTWYAAVYYRTRAVNIYTPMPSPSCLAAIHCPGVRSNRTRFPHEGMENQVPGPDCISQHLCCMWAHHPLFSAPSVINAPVLVYRRLN